MKHFKLFLFSVVLFAGFLTACSNNESVSENQDIQQSQAITESLNRLSQQFNSQGDVIPSANPSGNIVFDFGFDFVYPLNLSFNNGTTVTVNDLEELISIMINSTNELYINGIEFPFDVEIYDAATDSIIVITINNEDEFLELLESLNWEMQDNCNCTQEFDPVCIEITDPAGVSFVITYPNACYAFCDGFQESDFIDDCQQDYNNNTSNDCFTFNFPLTVITDQNQTITVNSQEELNNALYNAFYFDFVYPFDVTNSEGNVVSINNENDFIDLLEDCYGEVVGSCECPDVYNPVCVEIENPFGGVDVIEFQNACYAECEGFTSADFVDCNTNNPCIECENLPLNPVCVEVEIEGQLIIRTFPNPCFAECEGFTETDFIDCSGNTSECTTDAVLAILFECPWTVNGNVVYEFNSDGSVGITGSGLSTVGSWSIFMSNNGYPVVSISAEIGNFNDEWNFLDCNLINSLLVTSSNNPAGNNIVLSCD
ncbi:hypothetical protein AB9K26_06370 [Psychroserpens sp. XS_ASV72]|uniref:hypothetical protein n=1 Tax=Psychroserpens sp. XS_ASV72 TaxID=3241293 RepID=UPI003513DBDA